MWNTHFGSFRDLRLDPLWSPPGGAPCEEVWGMPQSKSSAEVEEMGGHESSNAWREGDGGAAYPISPTPITASEQKRYSSHFLQPSLQMSRDVDICCGFAVVHRSNRTGRTTAGYLKWDSQPRGSGSCMTCCDSLRVRRSERAAWCTLAQPMVAWLCGGGGWRARHSAL